MYASSSSSSLNNSEKVPPPNKKRHIITHKTITGVMALSLDDSQSYLGHVKHDMSLTFTCQKKRSLFRDFAVSDWARHPFAIWLVTFTIRPTQYCPDTWSLPPSRLTRQNIGFNIVGCRQLWLVPLRSLSNVIMSFRN